MHVFRIPQVSARLIGKHAQLTSHLKIVHPAIDDVDMAVMYRMRDVGTTYSGASG